jgi:cytochrome c biogenesis factor
MNRLVSSLWILAVSTLFVWITRIYNLLNDNEISSGERIWSVLVAFIFLLAAAAVIKVLIGSWRDRNILNSRLIPAFCIWTVTFWIVRSVGILIAEHDAGFKIVHACIAIVFILLALVVNRLKTIVSNI